MATGIENHHLGTQVVDVHLNRQRIFSFFGGFCSGQYGMGGPRPYLEVFPRPSQSTAVAC